MTGLLEGKVAVVTGGASGMGRATVERFVAEGAKVVFCDLPPESDEELLKRLGEVKVAMHHRGRKRGGPSDGWAIAERLGDNAHFVPADVSNREQLAAVVDAAIERFGGLDVMFNNAGIVAGVDTILGGQEEMFDRTVEVDVKAVWTGMQLAAPHMIKRGGGSIISTGSLAAVAGYSGLAAYSVAKAGVTGLTRSAAIELGPHNIRVNCICPGAIVTEIVYTSETAGLDVDTVRAMSVGLQPIPRSGEPADIAGAAVWLASDDSAFVSGQVINVDGGAGAEASPVIRTQLVGISFFNANQPETVG